MSQLNEEEIDFIVNQESNSGDLMRDINMTNNILQKLNINPFLKIGFMSLVNELNKTEGDNINV